MAGEEKSTYDTVPYTSLPFAQTHPDRLAALALLFGLDPPPLEHCRVLELGCASGGNLIPMALTLPDAEFAGIDLSKVEIDDGCAVVAALGLTNVRLSALSITDFDLGSGPYDYIIAHGVYSWVPDAVQTRILEICARQLSPHGIAFVSFNTLPGWSTRGVIRDLMRYHAAQFTDPRARLEQARGIAELLAGSLAAANSGYESLVREEVEALRNARDDYVLHEYLEDINEPLYFHEFVDRIASHGLTYLADADFGTMLAANFPQEVAQALVRLAPGVIRQEQYMDFLRNRTFRQALLVRAAEPINRKLTPDRLRKLGVSGAFELEKGPSDLRSNETVTFRGARGVPLRTAKPVTRAAAVILNESWPCAVPFDELYRRASAVLRDWAVPAGGADEAGLAAELLRCFGAGTVQFHARASPYTTDPGDQPTASALARLQACRDTRVTNLRSEPVQLDARLARLIQLLDGTRDRKELERSGILEGGVEPAVRQLARLALIQK